VRGARFEAVVDEVDEVEELDRRSSSRLRSLVFVGRSDSSESKVVFVEAGAKETRLVKGTSMARIISRASETPTRIP